MSERLNKEFPTPKLCEGDRSLVLLTLGVSFRFAATILFCRSAAVVYYRSFRPCSVALAGPISLGVHFWCENSLP